MIKNKPLSYPAGAGFVVGLCNILWLGVLVVVVDSYLWNNSKSKYNSVYYIIIFKGANQYQKVVGQNGAGGK